MTDYNTAYEDLLRKVLEEGNQKTDRTGTGTRSLFGQQMRFNLQEGFPLITTKKVHLRSIIHELLWFIAGDTNVKYLEDNNVKIWDAWRRPYQLGRQEVQVTPKPLPLSPAPYLNNPEAVLPLYEAGTLEWKLANEWVKMVKVHQTSPTPAIPIAYRWHSVENFIEDAQQLPHWFYKKNSWDDFALSPNYYGEAQFSPDTAVWLHVSELDTTPPVTPEPGRAILRIPLYETGDLGPVYGAMWRSWPAYNADSIDQLQNVIEDLKSNPDSRRHIVAAWNPALLDQQALPPCHAFFQFYVADGKLSCQLYQRSADLFLGVPFNIASYALLTHIVAQQTGLDVGEFVWTGGDCHIYDNHVEQVETQLTREPFPFPTLTLKKADSIDGYQFDDFQVKGYESHGTLRGAVAV